MKTREQALETLKSLNPAPIFLQCYQTRKLPHNLDIYFGPPEEFFLAPETQETYTQGRLTPLLDDGNFGLVTFYDPTEGTFVVMDVECPEEAREKFGNWQQYLADLLIRIGETIDDDTKLKTISGIVGFKYFDELLSFFERCERNESYEAFLRRQREFIGALKS